MKTTKENRTRNLTVRFTEAEFKTLQERFSETTCRKLADYIRKLLFSKPVTVLTRDQSMDEAARELMGLKTELNRIGNNYNQVVQKMHILKSLPQMEPWTRRHDSQHTEVFLMLKAIYAFIQKTGEQWLR